MAKDKVYRIASISPVPFSVAAPVDPQRKHQDTDPAPEVHSIQSTVGGAPGGYAVTEDVPAHLWDAWAAAYPNHPVLENGLAWVLKDGEEPSEPVYGWEPDLAAAKKADPKTSAKTPAPGAQTKAS